MMKNKLFKSTLLLVAMLFCCMIVNGKGTSMLLIQASGASDNSQYGSSKLGSTTKTYKYITTDLDTELLITNLEYNVQGYMDYCRKHYGWSDTEVHAFYNAYIQYLDAIKSGRLSTRSDGTIIDISGRLGNGEPIYKDNKGRILTQMQYDALKDKNKKKIIRFYPNRQAAAYIDKIARDLYEKKFKNK